MADNTATLAAGEAAWKGRAGAPAAPPPVHAGSAVNFQANGDGAATAFSVPHGLTAAPSSYAVTPTSAAAAAAHYVSSVTASAIIVTFSAAPAAGTNNVKFHVLVAK